MEIPVIQSEQNEQEHVGTRGFVFIYESEGKFYSELDKIEKTDGKVVIIHPVYYSGYDNTMTSETIVFKDGEYVSESSDGSWLDTIKQYPDIIFTMDNEEAIYHDGEYFHCDGCLLENLVGELEKVDIVQ